MVERIDVFRTWPATTAKPRPCSLARAASIVAFRASRLVWLAMSATSATPALQVPTAIAMRAATGGWVEGRDSAIEQILDQVLGWRLQRRRAQGVAEWAQPWKNGVALQRHLG
jgi:hypothetical protein